MLSSFGISKCWRNKKDLQNRRMRIIRTIKVMRAVRRNYICVTDIIMATGSALDSQVKKMQANNSSKATNRTVLIFTRLIFGLTEEDSCVRLRSEISRHNMVRALYCGADLHSE